MLTLPKLVKVLKDLEDKTDIETSVRIFGDGSGVIYHDDCGKVDEVFFVSLQDMEKKLAERLR